MLDTLLYSSNQVLDKYTLDALEHMEEKEANIKQPPGFPPGPGKAKFGGVGFYLLISGHQVVRTVVDGKEKDKRFDVD